MMSKMNGESGRQRDRREDGTASLSDDRFREYLATVAHLPAERVEACVDVMRVFRKLVPRSVKDRRVALEVFERHVRRVRPEGEVPGALDAVRHYWYAVDRVRSGDPGARLARAQEVLVERARRLLRLQHKSYRTERSYLSWIRRFLAYSTGVDPERLEEGHVRRFLSFLAVERGIAASTQSQAFNAILFLYRYILLRPIESLRVSIRSKRPRRLPVVLTRKEVHAVLAGLPGAYGLMGRLIYGAGLRLRECLSLRIMDLEFEAGRILVRMSKGRKDRSAILPRRLAEELKAQIRTVRVLFQRDRAQHNPGVPLPMALARRAGGATGTICTPRRSSGISRRRSERRESPRRRPFTPCGTASQRTSSKPAATSGPCRSSSDTRALRPR